MLLSQVDFDKYREKILNNFSEMLDTNDKFESYIKDKLSTQNIKSFLSDIIRAENVINHIEANKDIKPYTEIELILKANLIKNMVNLLSWKQHDTRVSNYLKNIDKEELEVVKKLELFFSNYNVGFIDKISIGGYTPCDLNIVKVYSLDEIRESLSQMSKEDFEELLPVIYDIRKKHGIKEEHRILKNLVEKVKEIKR